MNLGLGPIRLHWGTTEHPGELRFMHGISTHGTSHGERRTAHYFGRQLRWWCGLSSNSDRPWFLGLTAFDQQQDERVPVLPHARARLEPEKSDDTK